MSVFEQGDLIEVDFNPSVGHEPGLAVSLNPLFRVKSATPRPDVFSW